VNSPYRPHDDTGPLPVIRPPAVQKRKRRRGPDWATVLTIGLALGLAGGIISFAGVAGYLHPLTILKRDIVRDIVHDGAAAPSAPASRGTAVHGSQAPLVSSPAALPVVVPSPAAPVTRQAQPPVAPRTTRPAIKPTPSRSPSPSPSLTTTQSSPTASSTPPSLPPTTTVSTPPPPPTHPTTLPITPPSLPPSTTAIAPSPAPEIS
jgi:hypothetical protein